MLGDGFDDDFEVGPRETRPLAFSIDAVQRAVLEGSRGPLDAAAAALAALSVPASEPWHALCTEVLETSTALVAGEYLSVLRSPAARVLLRPVDEEERETTSPSKFSDLVSLFRWRAHQYVCYGDADRYADEPGSLDTPATYRAALVVFLAAACLNIYTQANWTGPEFEPNEIGEFHPLPFMRALLDMPDWEPSVAPAWHRGPADAARTRQWDGGAAADSGSSGSTAEGMDDAALNEAISKPRPLEVKTALSALTVTGDEAYEHLEAPHFLVTARALLAAVSVPVSVASTTVERAATSSEASEAASIDPRFKKLILTAHALCGLPWWHARAIVIHQRSLVERSPSLLLWRQAAGFFRRAAVRHFCPEHAPAFHSEDRFLRGLVEAEFGATAMQGGDRAALGEGAGRDGDDNEDLEAVLRKWEEADAAGEGGSSSSSSSSSGEGASSASAPAPAATPAPAAASSASAAPSTRLPSALVARLLLEWGLAQHYFKKESAAKTSFFLAKRETRLATMLTGALGKRTKFQSFDLAQLVLKAASTGPQKEAALAEALHAEALGAAGGKYGAAYVRETQAAAAGEEAAPEAAAAAVGGEPTMPGSVTVLGGIRQVTLDEVDPDNILLEEVKFRPAALDGVETQEDRDKEKFLFGKGWAVTVGLTKPAGDEGGSEGGAAAAASTAPSSAPASSSLSDDGVRSTAVTTDPGSTGDAAASSAAASFEDGPVSALDQCVILALCLDIRNHNPADGLTQEEMRPYVSKVLDTPLNWMVYSTGLLVKSWLEFESHRTQERAALQLQALVDQHTNKLTATQASMKAIASAAPAGDRMSHVYCLVFPARWELKRQCADRFKKLGVYRSALQMYEELEMWDDIIDCHVVMDRVKRAERLLRARLAVAPTPRLWCVLGVVTDSDGPFETAWEVSKQQFARAKLGLAQRYFQRGDLPSAIAALRAGLALAPHNEREWFMLGVSLMRTGEAVYDGAVEAFSRVVSLDPTNADAWANLGGIFLQQRKWEKGYSALEHALRVNRADWRMWSNFLVASMRTRNFSRAISVMHQLVDMRHKDERNEGVDLPALGLLVQEVLASAKLEDEKAAVAAAAGDASTAAEAAISSASASEDGGLFPAPPAATGADSDDEDGADDTPEALAAAAARRAAEQHLDSSGQPAAAHLERVAKLFGHITSAVTKHARVWSLYAMVQEARGRRADATDCRLRACRALQTGGWERDEAAVGAVIKASKDLVRSYMAAASDPREGPVARSRALLHASMHCATVVNKVTAGERCASHPELEALRGLQAEADAAAAALKAAAAAAPSAP